MSGDHDLDRIQLRPEKFYSDNAVDLILGIQVEKLDCAAHRLSLSDGRMMEYDKLIMATGSRVRRLDHLPGADLGGIHYLRTVEDADSIRESMGNAQNIVIVGGGYIGLEVASVAVDISSAVSPGATSVTILEAQSRILARVATEQLSNFFARIHTDRGVSITTNASVTVFTGEGSITGVTLADGTVVPADLAVIGVGIVPNVEVAEAAGIQCDNGIIVDEYCRTSGEDVLAAGDCASHPSPLLGRNIRLESVPNAMEQARIAAAAACGNLKPYTAEPWFWSDQYDLKLQMTGFAESADTHITRGDEKSNQFITFHLRDGVVVGADAVNSVRDFLPCRKLVAAGAKPDPTSLVDVSVSVKDLVG